ARQLVANRYSRPAVAALVRAELAHCRELVPRRGAEDVEVPNQGRDGDECREQPKEACPTLLAEPFCPRPQPFPERIPSSPLPPIPLSPLPGQTPSPRRLRGELRCPKANPVPLDPPAEVDFREVLGRQVRVRWEGDQSLLSSLARVNREFCLALLASPDVELAVSEHRIPWHTLTERDDPRFGPLFARRGAGRSG